LLPRASTRHEFSKTVRVTNFMSAPPVRPRHDGVRYLYMLAAFVIIVAGIRAAESILNPVLLAVFLSVICAPAYFALLQRGISQWLSLLIIAGGLSAVAVMLLAVVMQSLSSFTANQQRHQQQIPERLAELRDWMETWLPDMTDENATADTDSPSTDEDIAAAGSEIDDGPSSASTTRPDLSVDPQLDEMPREPARPGEPSELATQAAESTENGMSPPDVSTTLMDQIYDQFNPGTIISFAVRLAGSLQNLLRNTVLIVLTVVFILLEAGSFEAKLSRAFPQRDDTTEQAAQMVHSVQRYMAIKTVISIFTAILIGSWLKLFGVSYIWLWVLLTFLLNFIPNIGSIVAAVPAVVIAWLEFGILPALGCSVGYIVVNVVIGNFLEPRFMGQNLGLSPLVIFCSMVFWGWALGPVGMLLSVPLTMAVHIVLNGFDDTQWIATLMGGRTPNKQ